MKFNQIIKIFTEGVATYAPLLFIIAAALAFARVLTLLNVPQTIATTITSVFTTKVSILLIINVLLLFVGMVMDTGPAILILTPILVPITNAFGIDPVHFGIIMVVNLAIGFVTPPIGINLFVTSSFTGVPVMHIARAAAPFILMFFIALIFITFVPAISLALL
jgi:C4-dicarboxylate transporter DctM subunit